MKKFIKNWNVTSAWKATSGWLRSLVGSAAAILTKIKNVQAPNSPCQCPLKSIFATEVPVDILPNILEVLDMKLQKDVQGWLSVMIILQIMADSKR